MNPSSSAMFGALVGSMMVNAMIILSGHGHEPYIPPERTWQALSPEEGRAFQERLDERIRLKAEEIILRNAQLHEEIRLSIMRDQGN